MREVLNQNPKHEDFLLPYDRFKQLDGVELTTSAIDEQYQALLNLDIDIRQVIDAEWYALDPDEKRGPMVLHPGRMAWTVTSAFEDETNNGGLEQFFFNSSGNYALETIDGLRLIKSDELAEILAEAIALFPNALPYPERAKRMDMLDNIDRDALEHLDDRFFKIGTSMLQRMRYAKNHPELFFRTP